MRVAYPWLMGRNRGRLEFGAMSTTVLPTDILNSPLCVVGVLLIHQEMSPAMRIAVIESPWAVFSLGRPCAG